jgi:TrbL/VirB6 plasmid conjugal transfer protein
MNVMGYYFLAVSASGASGGGMDFDSLFPLVRVDAHNLYNALVPFVFVAAFGLLIYEAYRVLQGQASSLYASLLRIAVAVVLCGNFQDWCTTATGAMQDLVAQVGGGTSYQEVMDDYNQVLKNPGADTGRDGGLLGFWESITNPKTAVGDTVLKAAMWLLGTIAEGLTWVMNALQRFLFLLAIAAGPIFFGLWMLTGTRSIGLRYLLSVIGLSLWPLGWAFGNIVTKAIIQQGVNHSTNWLDASAFVLIIGGLWMVINALFWPALITKTITSGVGAGGGWIVGGVSPLVSAGSSMADGATLATAAGGGSIAPTMVATSTTSLASRPTGSPSPDV